MYPSGIPRVATRGTTPQKRVKASRAALSAAAADTTV